MTAGSNCLHLNRPETDDARSIGPAYQTTPAKLQHCHRSRDEVRQIVKDRGDGNEVKLIEQLRTYYLIPGTIVQVIQKDAASGTSQIQLKRVSRPLWTLSKFLSVRPITDLDNKIETPFDPGTTLNNAIGTSEN